MLTTLASLKTRLAIPDADIQYDSLLTTAIQAVTARFDLETHRTLARTENATFEFPAQDTHVVVPSYPIETVARFELKETNPDSWIEQTGVDFLVRARCVICLRSQLSTLNFQLARVTYTGGYVLPGTIPAAGQTPLPAELESAAVEQVTFWFQNRDKLGQIRNWPSGGNYIQLADTDLLPSVRSVLRSHTRLLL